MNDNFIMNKFSTHFPLQFNLFLEINTKKRNNSNPTQNKGTHRYDLLQNALVRPSPRLCQGTALLADPGEEAKLCPDGK